MHQAPKYRNPTNLGDCILRKVDTPHLERRVTKVGIAGRTVSMFDATQEWVSTACQEQAVTACRVDIIIYPGFQSLETLSSISVLTYANRVLERRGIPKRYDIQVVSLTKGIVLSDTGVALKAGRALSKRNLPHTAMIMGAYDIDSALRSGDQIVQWCAWAAGRVKRMAALCSGCFFLAEAGLLDGRKVTTHWSVADVMRKKYPSVEVEDDSLFTCAGNLWTSAGVSTAVDLALAFVEDDCGRQTALDVARELVVFVKRPGGQSQFDADLAGEVTPSAGIRDVQSWILENLQCKISVERMAKRTCMSVRHFARVFRGETGLTPSQFVERARIEKALRLLEQSSLPLKAIAFHCGFTSDEQMRKVFKKRFSMTAREYRRQHPRRNEAHRDHFQQGRPAPL